MLNAAFGRLAGASPSVGAPSGGAPSTPQASSSDSLMDGQRRQNKLLVALREDAALRGLLLRAAAETQASVSSPDDDVVLYVLLPQSVTLDDVAITQELVETHLVHMRRPSGRSSGEAGRSRRSTDCVARAWPMALSQYMAGSAVPPTKIARSAIPSVAGQ